MKTLYYFPLEQYPERYTALMSCKDGWAEDHFKEAGVKFVRVEGKQISATIRAGSVLDAAGRCSYSMSQLTNFIENYLPKVKNGDVVYLEDFWHLGAESLFYIRALTGVKFKIGCFCHAQSVDETDFTYSMRDWMRPIEKGFARQYDYIFTCSKILREKLISAGVAKDGGSNIHTVGLPFNSYKLMCQLRKMGMRKLPEKEPFVLFSSRFDDEKDPMFFLDLVERCPDIQFRLVSPYTTRPVSRNPEVMERLTRLIRRPNSNLALIPTHDKLAYYTALAKAWVQFNCAHQDWVSWTLVEATLFNCHPLYPRWKDFPLELRNRKANLYVKRDLADCERKLRVLMKKYSNDITKYAHDGDCGFVFEKHDRSWPRYLEIMGLTKKGVAV